MVQANSGTEYVGLTDEALAALAPGPPADVSGLATEETLGRRFAGAKLAYAAVLSTTTDIVPTVGKAIRVLWVAFVPNSDNANANLVSIGFASGSALYVGYALAHWERFDGAVNDPLRITLANSAPVAVTVHYEEF